MYYQDSYSSSDGGNIMNGGSGGMTIHSSSMQPTDDLGASPLPMSFPMSSHGGYNMGGEGSGHHLDNVNPLDQGGISMEGYPGVDMSHLPLTSTSPQGGLDINSPGILLLNSPSDIIPPTGDPPASYRHNIYPHHSPSNILFSLPYIFPTLR